MNCQNLTELLKAFESKIETIYELIPLSQLYDNYVDKNEWKRNAVLDSNHLNCNNSDNYSKQLVNKRPDLRDISQMVIEMKTMTDEMKCLLTQQKRQTIKDSNKCKNDLKLIETHCQHIHQNIPLFLHKSNSTQVQNKSNQMNDKNNGLAKRQTIGHKNEVSKVIPKNIQKAVTKGNPNLNINIKSTEESRVANKSVKKKVISKDLKNIPNISFITTEEFASIPHYMLGRLTYEVINRAIADYNRTIGAKYKIIGNYSTKYSDEDMRKYVAFKEQENTETDGEFFCTINDLKVLSDLKVDPTIRKIMMCLRHCRRIREIRGNPPKLIRYAVIKQQFSIE